MRTPQADRGVRTPDSGKDHTALPINDASFGDEGIDDPPPSNSAERSEAAQEPERERERRGNRGPDEIDGFGQGV